MPRRDHSIDTLRTLATVMVVLLHVASNYVHDALNAGNLNPDFWLANLIDSFCRASVPLFVLVSGRFLIGQRISMADFYRKRARRLLYPLLGWSLFYSLFTLAGQYQSTGLVDLPQVGLDFIMGTPYYHLWFLFLLVGLYLFTPFIHLLRDAVLLRTLHLFGWGMLAFGVVNSFYNTSLNTGHAWFFLWFVNYLGFYVLGYTWPLMDTKKQFWWPLLIYLVASLFIALSIPYTWAYWQSTYFYGYLTLPVVAGALAVYALFCRVELTENTFSRLAPYSFGIFLLHPFFLTLINKSPLGNYLPGLESAWVGIGCKFILIFLLAGLVTYLLRLHKLTARLV